MESNYTADFEAINERLEALKERLNIHGSWIGTLDKRTELGEENITFLCERNEKQEKDIKKTKKDLAILQNHIQEMSEFELFLLKMILQLSEKAEYFKTLLEYITGKTIQQIENEYREKEERKLRAKNKYE